MGKHNHHRKHKVLQEGAAGLIRDERGAVMLMTVLLIAVLIGIAGLAADFARLWVAQEEMQGAVDAAALAGSMDANRMVSIDWMTGHLECDEFG